MLQWSVEWMVLLTKLTKFIKHVWLISSCFEPIRFLSSTQLIQLTLQWRWQLISKKKNNLNLRMFFTQSYHATWKVTHGSYGLCLWCFVLLYWVLYKRYVLFKVQKLQSAFFVIPLNRVTSRSFQNLCITELKGS